MLCSRETSALHLNVSFIDASARKSILRRINFTFCIALYHFKWPQLLSDEIWTNLIAKIPINRRIIWKQSLRSPIITIWTWDVNSQAVDDNHSTQQVRKRVVSGQSQKCAIPSLLVISRTHLHTQQRYLKWAQLEKQFKPTRRASTTQVLSRNYNRRAESDVINTLKRDRCVLLLRRTMTTSCWWLIAWVSEDEHHLFTQKKESENIF